MARSRKPKVKPPKVELTPAQKKLRRQARAEERKRNPPPEKFIPDPNFWQNNPNLGKKYNTDPTLYIWRCSCKCLRTTENPPLSICGEGAYHTFKDEKGKLRWMMSFKKRSQRDEMIREGKSTMGRKCRKEPNREA